MLTVSVDQSEVERRLAAGELRCPGCGEGTLRRWGFARRRWVRELDRGRWLCPRRSRCGWCGVTHVLLPADVLLRRADGVEVVGAALAARATGVGARWIAEGLGRPWETVRGWLRRFAVGAGPVRAWFTRLLCQLVADPRLPAPTGGVFADAVAAIVAVAGAVAGRFQVAAVTVWQVAAAVSLGRLLAPGWPSESINTSWPWPAAP